MDIVQQKAKRWRVQNLDIKCTQTLRAKLVPLYFTESQKTNIYGSAKLITSLLGGWRQYHQYAEMCNNLAAEFASISYHSAIWVTRKPLIFVFPFSMLFSSLCQWIEELIKFPYYKRSFCTYTQQFEVGNGTNAKEMFNEVAFWMYYAKNICRIVSRL